MALLSDHVKALKEQTTEPKQMALFYGDSFAGKTWIVAQFARNYNLLWFDLENGWSTLIKAIPPEYHNKVELIKVNDTPENALAAKTMVKFIRSPGPITVDSNTGQILGKPTETSVTINPKELTTNTILVVDTLTALSDSAMNHYLGTLGVGGLDGMTFKKKEFSHYDHQGLFLSNVLVGAQRLPCHVIFISHQEELEQEDGTQKLSPTGGTRNFSLKLARKFDHVIHCKVYNKKHSYNSMTVKDHRVIAGSRLEVDVTDEESVLNLFKGNFDKSNTDAKSSSVKANVTSNLLKR